MDTDTLVANPTSIRERIDEALESLSNLANAKRSRSDIIADLAKDLSEYYGYIEELSAFLLDLFSPSECVEYMDASDRPRPLVIRTNTLKTTRKDLMEALGKRGAALEAIDWSKVAIKVTESSVPIGATPEYLAGYYMLQSAASLNPVMALAPLPGEKVLDMSAAPGGKTSYIAQLMKNSGTVIANDLKPQRQKATVANLHRLGVKNTTVCCYDGRKINQIFKGFDRVLLDAPCSGLGVISRDQSVKLQRTVKDIQRIAHLQKELLRAAVDAVDPKSPTGGIIVYSTCSISTEENEQVVDYILQKRFVRLIDTGLEVGKPGLTRHMEKRFHPSLALTRRFYPHVHNMDGFYVAKFQKYANGVRGEEDGNDEDEEEEGEYDSDGNSIHHSEEGSEMDVEESEEESSDDEEEEVPPPPPAKKSGKKDSKHPEPVAPPAPVVPAKKETPPAAAPVKKDAAPVAASKKVESKAETVKPSAASAKESADKKAPAAETKAAVPISISPKISKVNIKQPVKEVVKEEEEKPVAVAAPVAASSGSKRSAKAEPEKEPSSSSSSNKKVKKVEPEPSSSEESDDDEDEEEEEEVQVPRRIGKRMSIKELRRVMTLKKALSKK